MHFSYAMIITLNQSLNISVSADIAVWLGIVDLSCGSSELHGDTLSRWPATHYERQHVAKPAQSRHCKKRPIDCTDNSYNCAPTVPFNKSPIKSTHEAIHKVWHTHSHGSFISSIGACGTGWAIPNQKDHLICFICNAICDMLCHTAAFRTPHTERNTSIGNCLLLRQRVSVRAP